MARIVDPRRWISSFQINIYFFISSEHRKNNMKEKKFFRLGSPSPQPYSDVSGQMCIGYGVFFGIEVYVTLQENCFHPPSSCW